MRAHVSARRTTETRYSFAQELWNHRAHTIMLREQKILERRDAARILRALEEIDRIGPDRFPIDPGTGELLFSVERYLQQRIGDDTASRMHTGRSRGDLYVCVERMVFREKILTLADVLVRLTNSLLARAAQHAATVMPGYTLLQHAQPITFGHYLLSFADRFLRDLTRLRETFRRVNRSPMGSAILSGTTFPVNRPRMAALLGFDGVIENTRDASTARDHSLEMLAHTAILASNLMALCEDLILWCTYEFSLIELADGFSGTSSIMPQKKNPSALTRVRHLAAECVGDTMTGFMQLKTHSEQLNDLEATGPVVWHALDTAIAATDLLRATVATLKVKPERMAQLAGANFIQAPQLAETIAQEERLPFRVAHRIVARLVRNCIEAQIALAQMEPGMINEAAVAVLGRPLEVRAATLRKCIDVASAIRERKAPGGPGRREVKRMLKERTASLARDARWIRSCRESVEKAREATDQRAKQLMKPTTSRRGRNA
jgi:argininosuccinate lyase